MHEGGKDEERVHEGESGGGGEGVHEGGGER